MSRTRLVVVSLVAGIAVGAVATQVVTAKEEPVKRTVLLTVNLGKVKRGQAKVVLAELAPGSATGKRSHAGHELAYVLEGAITLEVEGESPVTFKQGGSFYQPPDQVHSVKNAKADAPAKVLLVSIAKAGGPPGVVEE